jgi:hypothetical protein
MPEFYDLSDPVPDDPQKKDGDGAKKAKSGIQVGSTDSNYKPKRKAQPKPPDPRVVKMRLVGLSAIIALALVFIGFQLFGGRKSPESASNKQTITSNPNIAMPGAVRQPLSKPIYRPAATYKANKSNAPGFAPTAEDRSGVRQADPGEGIH